MKYFKHTLQILYIFPIILLTLSCASITKVSEADSLEPIQQEQKANLFVFVGEKISVEQFTPKLEDDEIMMDSAFNAEYKIIKKVYGEYDNDTIKFEVYDHYGNPPFADYKYVLLFVSKYDGKYIHQKYQYFDVYKTKNGKWASCGDPYRFDEYHRKEVDIEDLEFDVPVIFDMTKYNDVYRKEIFIKPYFKVTNNNAKCLKGAYLDTLFNVKKNGVLKARNVFD